MHFLDFEKPIAELEGKIEELRHLSDADGMNIAEEVARLQQKVEKQLKAVYAKLSPWQKTQVARHPDRPHALDYLKILFTDVTPLAGDRVFGEDRAIVGGLARFRGQPVVILGQEKGHDTETRLRHNFGMAMPEGYRKAQRLMELADTFNLPVLTLVDTAGAYPGVAAEERGQAEAIARSIQVGLNLKVPVISCVIGEGGSGGAIAIATGNVVMMLEHSIYSVISPEGCASILWRSGDQAQQAAEALRLTAQDLLDFKVIDEVIPEPLGGAHRDREATFTQVGDAFERHLRELNGLEGGILRARRREKFLRMGREGLA
ncbi:acetyl-CoA carboxylase carboxyltransferase subunit alpha [Pararhodospirillum photometricum]|nr:acetyl-CoA carboxylase carboxyltransferase subunit alpha [Pararhodospirillum photometricum]